MNMTNNIMLNTHRGEPFVFINDKDAASLGITNGEKVKVVNDVGEMHHPGEGHAVVPAGPGDRLQRLRALHARRTGTARRTSNPAT